ncbi:MAG: hypothetical protein HYX90_03320, partial [Chloroflexi bacterium]|nr:hypothetical protein [Chloroflexota bacterium]
MEKQVSSLRNSGPVNTELLQRIDGVRLSTRLDTERAEFFKRELEVTGDRSVLAVESWKESEGDALDVRWARLVLKWAEQMPIVIFKGQLVVGSQTKLFRGADPWVEYEAPNLLEIMEADKRQLRQSAARVSSCTDEEWEAVAEAVSFFSGKTPVDAMFKNME